MKTNEQTVIVEQEKSAKLKKELMDEFNSFLKLTTTDEKISRFHTLHEKATAYFNHMENFVANSDLLGAHSNENWAINLAETCLSILESIYTYYDFIIKFADTSKKFKLKLSFYTPSTRAFSSMQKMVKFYLPDNIKSLKSKFTKLKLPIAGFRGNLVPPPKKITIEKIICIATGIFFTLIILIIAIAIPNPEEFQIFIFRTILSISAGLIGALIPGFLEVESKFKSFSIRATGAIGLCIIVYLVNPPALFHSGEESQKTSGIGRPIIIENVSEGGVVNIDRNSGDEKSSTHFKAPKKLYKYSQLPTEGQIVIPKGVYFQVQTYMVGNARKFKSADTLQQIIEFSRAVAKDRANREEKDIRMYPVNIWENIDDIFEKDIIELKMFPANNTLDKVEKPLALYSSENIIMFEYSIDEDRKK